MRKISILSVLILIGCATNTYHSLNNVNPCAKAGPFCSAACVDDPVGLVPRETVIHTGRGQVVHVFLTSSTNDITVRSDAFDSTDHDGNGHAWGHVDTSATLGRHKYTIHNNSNGKENDPDIMIDY